MSSFALVARQAAVASLRSSGPAALNWLYLVENIVVVILVLFVRPPQLLPPTPADETLYEPVLFLL